MSKAANTLSQKIGAVLFEEQDNLEWPVMYEAVGTLVVGMFLKTAFDDGKEGRMEAFDEFCADIRKGIEMEVAAGKGVEDTEGEA